MSSIASNSAGSRRLITNDNIWMVVFLASLTLPNIVAIYFDASATKWAGWLLSCLLFFGFYFLKNRILIVLFTPVFLFSFFDTVYFLQYGAHISAGVINVIVESDLKEAGELISTTIDFTLPILAGYVFLYAYLFFRSSLSLEGKPTKKLVIVLLSLPLLDYIGNGSSVHSFPLNLLHSSFTYLKLSHESRQLINNRNNFSFNAKYKKVSVGEEEIEESYILVLGESARRDHHAYHGYSRDTTPHMKRLQPKAIFRDVIAPSNSTIASIKATISMATAEDGRMFSQANSLLSLAKEATYMTYWISSQARFGKFESSTGTTAGESNKTIFINKEWESAPVYDAELIPHIQAALKESGLRKLIVVHLNGSHVDYDKRYPEEFNYYKHPPPNYVARGPGVHSKVNQYDNSIRYTDYVLSMIVDSLKERKIASCLIYTADHGEYLAENDDHTGHGYPVPLKSEIEVPFLVWCSDRYRQQYKNKWENILNNQSLAVSNEDLFYSIADLLNIEFQLMKAEHSFFGPVYRPMKKKRRVNSSVTGQVYSFEDLR